MATASTNTSKCNVITLSADTTGANEPDANYDFDIISTIYFDHFIDEKNNNMTGLNYIFYTPSASSSTTNLPTPNISLRPNSRRVDIDQYYTNSFTIVKQIHNFENIANGNVSTNDLEMIIEHRPDPNNTRQNFVYVCLGFKREKPATVDPAGFKVLFDQITPTQILKNKTIEEFGTIPKFNQVLTGYIEKNKDTKLKPNAYLYYDSSDNAIIVFNHLIGISDTSFNYYTLTEPNRFACPDLTKIFEKTDFQPVGNMLPLKIKKGNPLKETFATLQENFASLREGVEGNTASVQKPQYCRPYKSEDKSLGKGDSIVTATISDVAKKTEDSVLLNDITMLFIVIVVFITMCIVSPIIYLETNKFSNYNIAMLWSLRIISCIIFFIGGIISIIASRQDESLPWLGVVGIIMILAYGMFYIVVFVFQKNIVITQLTNTMQDEIDPLKTQLQHFILNQFGPI